MESPVVPLGNFMPPTDSQKINPADVFRDALDGTAEIARSMQPYCTTVEELVGVIELAMANDGQLKMLMEKVSQPKAKR